MSSLPAPIRVTVGLSAVLVDELRKMPTNLPKLVTTVPMAAISTTMGAILRVRQEITALATRGDEVLASLYTPSDEPPPWAVFDESPESPAEHTVPPKPPASAEPASEEPTNPA